MKHVVGFSGGIDSQAVCLWLLNRYDPNDVIILNSDAGGWEHPLTVEHVDWYSRNVHPVISVRPKIRDMWKTEGFAEKLGFDGSTDLDYQTMCVIKKRAPSRTAQFCTSILKLVPMKRWHDENLTGVEFERYSGVRRDESHKRRDAQARSWDDYFDCYLNLPLADWSKQDCFDVVRSAGEQINPLYGLGFNRVGCAPCVNANKDDILAWTQRFPEMIDKVRQLEERMQRTFFPPMVPGMVMNFIDDVVAWSKTSRGGRQTNLLRVVNERPACESKYGVCE